MGKASRRKASTRSQRIADSAGNVVRNIGASTPVVIRGDLPQELKISHALVALLETEVPHDAPLEEFQAALRFIIIAWNMSLMGDDQRSAALQDLAADIKGLNDGVRRAILADVEKLIATKEALFPHDNRFVVSGELQRQGNKLRVTAAALIPPT